MDARAPLASTHGCRRSGERGPRDRADGRAGERQQADEKIRTRRVHPTRYLARGTDRAPPQPNTTNMTTRKWLLRFYQTAQCRCAFKRQNTPRPSWHAPNGTAYFRRRPSRWCRSWGSLRYAIPKALTAPGWRPDDIDVYEIHEAFCAARCSRSLVTPKQTGYTIPDDELNPNGGAVRTRPSLGDSGTRLLLSLSTELVKTGKRFGVIGVCVGSATGWRWCSNASHGQEVGAATTRSTGR